MAYHLLSPGQPTVPSDYAYYHLVPASCPPLLGFYPSFPSGYGTAPVAARGAVITDCGDLPLALGQAVPAANQRAKAISRATALPKVSVQIVSEGDPAREHRDIVSSSGSLRTPAAADVPAPERQESSESKRDGPEGGADLQPRRSAQRHHAGGRCSANR